jgi:hypothetical protein
MALDAAPAASVTARISAPAYFTERIEDDACMKKSPDAHVKFSFDGANVSAVG